MDYTKYIDQPTDFTKEYKHPESNEDNGDNSAYNKKRKKPIKDIVDIIMSIIIFAGAIHAVHSSTYNVLKNEVAVVSQGDLLTLRTQEGWAIKLPYIEKVNFYPKFKHASLKSEIELKDGNMIKFEGAFYICLSKKVSQNDVCRFLLRTEDWAAEVEQVMTSSMSEIFKKEFKAFDTNELYEMKENNSLSKFVDTVQKKVDRKISTMLAENKMPVEITFINNFFTFPKK